MTPEMGYPTARSAWSPPEWMPERPTGTGLEAWCYTDKYSYLPGETVDLHVHTTAATYTVEVIRDGLHPETVLTRDGLPGRAWDTPEDAYARGCGWPVATSLSIPADWESGMYLIVIRAQRDNVTVENEHFFVVRPIEPGKRTPFVLILTTSTLLAYNDWGGANHYRGMGSDPTVDVGSPLSSMHRPIGRGFLRKPPGAPRNRHEYVPPPFWEPRYEAYEWARLRGYSRHHADAFWATYERPFVVWAQQNDIVLDIITQDDLDRVPGILNGYRCAVIVGHDEYWSWAMRDAMDEFLEAGGNVARFGANYLWQVRLEGSTQVCFKYDATERDPKGADDDRHLTSAAWDHPITTRPGAHTFGLTGTAGTYCGYGASAPRGHGGFTVYRPGHWALEGSDLYYGDVLGAAPARIGTFEVDGCDYTFVDGLPHPTGNDHTPDDLEIIAMGPALTYEEDHFAGRVPLGDPGTAGDDSKEGVTWRADADGHRRPTYGAGMMATFTKGKGTVFNSGSSEWVAGLIHRDWFVEKITATVLQRLGDTGSHG